MSSREETTAKPPGDRILCRRKHTVSISPDNDRRPGLESSADRQGLTDFPMSLSVRTQPQPDSVCQTDLRRPGAHRNPTGTCQSGLDPISRLPAQSAIGRQRFDSHGRGCNGLRKGDLRVRVNRRSGHRSIVGLNHLSLWNHGALRSRTIGIDSALAIRAATPHGHSRPPAAATRKAQKADTHHAEGETFHDIPFRMGPVSRNQQRGSHFGTLQNSCRNQSMPAVQPGRTKIDGFPMELMVGLVEKIRAGSSKRCRPTRGSVSARVEAGIYGGFAERVKMKYCRQQASSNVWQITAYGDRETDNHPRQFSGDRCQIATPLVGRCRCGISTARVRVRL